MPEWYAVCREAITSPAPSEGALALGLRPNQECGHFCKVVARAPVMQFKCPLGHDFVATDDQLVEFHEERARETD